MSLNNNFKTDEDNLINKLSYVINSTPYYGCLSYRVNLKRKTIESLLIRRVISAITIIYFVVFIVIYLNELLNIAHIDNLQESLYTTFMLSSLFNCISLLYDSIVNGNDLIKLWTNLMNLDIYCERLNLRCKLKKGFTFLLVSVPCSFNIIFSTYDTYINRSHRTQVYALSYASCVFITCFVKMLAITHFVTFITIFNNYFVQLNEKLSDMRRIEDKTIFIRDIFKMHQHLYEMTLLIVKIYSLPILLIIIDTTMVLIGYFYDTIFLVTYDIKYHKLIFILFELCFIPNTIGIILCVPIVCEMCTNNANKLRETVMLTTNVERDKSIRKQMKVFCLQLQHDKLRIVAAGIMPLNFSVAFAMFGGISTYILFIIQFKQL